MKLVNVVLSLLSFGTLVLASKGDDSPDRSSRFEVKIAAARTPVGNGPPHTQKKNFHSAITSLDDSPLPPTSSSPSRSRMSETSTKLGDDILTNAERMRRGLPLKTHWRRSRTVAARAPAPSPTYCGRLRVVSSDEGYSGYVAANPDHEGRYVVTPDRSSAAKVYFSNHQLFPMGGNGAYHVLGATFGAAYQTTTGVNTFAGNSYNFAILSAVGETDYGVPATPGVTSYRPAPNNGVESSIFTLERDSEEILLTWINPDGSKVPSFWGIPAEGDLHPLVISADIVGFNAIYGGHSARVFCEAV